VGQPVLMDEHDVGLSRKALEPSDELIGRGGELLLRQFELSTRDASVFSLERVVISSDGESLDRCDAFAVRRAVRKQTAVSRQDEDARRGRDRA